MMLTRVGPALLISTVVATAFAGIADLRATGTRRAASGNPDRAGSWRRRHHRCRDPRTGAGPRDAVAADARVPARRPQDSRTGFARLSAVHGRLEQDPHRARRGRGRRVPFPHRRGVERRQRHRHVQGGCRLHERRRESDARSVPEARAEAWSASTTRSAATTRSTRRTSSAARRSTASATSRPARSPTRSPTRRIRSCRGCRTSRSRTRRSSC